MERQQFAKTNRGEHHGKTDPSLKAVLPDQTAASPLVQLQRNLGNQAFGHFFQAKLTVNQPGDIYEQEADRVAEQVMRMPVNSMTGFQPVSEGEQNPRLQRKCTACSSGGLCPNCAEEEQLQRKPLITPPLKGGGGMLQRQEMEEPEEEEEETLQAKEAPGAQSHQRWKIISMPCAAAGSRCRPRYARFLNRGLGMISARCGCIPMGRRRNPRGR